MSRHPFDLLMELETRHIRLDCAALHLARDVYPCVNIGRYVAMLDKLADEVGAQRPGLAANSRYVAMREVLVDSYGLTGNVSDYYDPNNSYINRVLDTGLGIPISLAVIWIEVARRLKWPVSGVALPGHFILRFDDYGRFVLVDPFYDGDTLSIPACRAIVRERFEGRVKLTPAHLQPVSTRGVLTRLLRHLRNTYLAGGELDRVATILRRLSALQPQNGRHLQELAAVCTRKGDVRGACAHLQLYLHREPDGRDSALVRKNLKQLQAALVAQN